MHVDYNGLSSKVLAAKYGYKVGVSRVGVVVHYEAERFS